MAPSSKPAAPPYAKDEKVLCFHHDMLYEAKIIEIDSTEEGGFRYKIHYKGWKATWDDWVPQDRIRKLNDENRELAAQLNQQARASMQKKSGPAKKAGLKNGSDFSSARGSEERSGAAATMSGRGRKRDFDLENNPQRQGCFRINRDSPICHQFYSVERESAKPREAGIQAKAAVHRRGVNQRDTSFQPRSRQHQRQQSHIKLCKPQPSLNILRALCKASALLVRPNLFKRFLASQLIDLMDAAFVKKEANWYKASLRYDNLSRLPPDSLSESNPDFKQALHDFYYTTTDEGLKSTLVAEDYCDAWPEIHKRPKPKKRELTPEDEDSDFLTAGVPPKDREVFNAELRSFMEENCPSEIEELPNPIAAKTLKAEKAKKAVVSREKRAAAKARSIMPPTQHTRNTRLRAAQAAQAATADADGQAPNGDASATQNATAVVAAPDAEVVSGRSRQCSAPPFNSFMRDTRAAMTRNAFMSRPVRGVVANSYYAALNKIYPKPRSVGDEPIGNDIPSAPANGQEPAASKPDAPTTIAPKNTVAPKKSTAHKPVAPKVPAPKKSAALKTTASKPTAPKNPTATPAATNKAASTKPINGGLDKDKSAAVKLPRAAKACDPCRSHKTRCTGGTPCDACRRRGFNCVYAPDGRKAPMKRAREDSQEVVKQETLDKDAEQESRPAKRVRKLKVASAKASADSKAGTINPQLSSAVPHIEEVPVDNAPGGRMAPAPKKRAREDNQEAVKKEPLDKDKEKESRPVKRARKLKLTSSKKDATNSSNSKAGTSNAQLSSILPSIEEVPEDNQGANAQLSKMHYLSQPKVGKNAANAAIQPTGTQSSSYSGRITRSRSRQLSEEAETHAAKLQHKGKRAREETQEPQERPAKLQRATRKGPNWRKPDGNPDILRAIDSMRVDSEGNAQTDDPWIGYEYEATWMSNTYTKWENSFDWPHLNFHFKQEESFHARPSIKLVMTDVLKGILVDDWEHVTKDSQLVPLPHEQPVVKILNDYLEDEMPKREEDSAQVDILKETMAGLREYFDRALGRILLYRFERLQYSELLPQWENEKEGGGPSNVYGGEHLCRLLVSLPELLAQTNMDQQSVSRLREELTKFTNWLSKNGQKYFVREYEVPGPEYQDKAKSS